jgi:hypothetical protein
MLLWSAALAGSVHSQVDSMVALRVQPKSGDTLRISTGGWVFMTLHVDCGTGDCCIVMGGTFNASRRLVTIERDDAGTILSAILDTLGGTWRGQRRTVLDEINRGLPEPFGTIRLLPDGSARKFGEPDVGDSILLLAVSSVAMLPAHLVHPGSVWEVHGVSYARADDFRDRQRATRIMIRFDSLSPRLDRAYMSYEGTVEGDSAPAPLTNGSGPEIPGAIYLVTGTLRGSLILDRERGYWSRMESYTVMHAQAVMSSDPKKPVRVRESEVFLTFETTSVSVLAKR